MTCLYSIVNGHATGPAGTSVGLQTPTSRQWLKATPWNKKPLVMFSQAVCVKLTEFRHRLGVETQTAYALVG